MRQSDFAVIISERLTKHYPPTRLGNKTNALDELLYIILSLQTNEQLYARSYRAFKNAFPRWDTVPDVPVRQITKVIRDSGLAAQKARHIHAISQKLRHEFGRVTLSPLKRMTTDEAEKFMLALPGVGIKTARCVLMYSLGHDVFPVDIHCARILDRLRLIDWNGKRLESVANAAQDAIPVILRKQLHVQFVQHGREICRAKPKCSSCILSDLCPSSAI